jgi:hypothetical protein
VNFTLSPPVRFQQPFRPDPRGPVGEDDDFPLFVFPPLLPPGAVRGILPERLFSTNFKLRSWVSPAALTVVPYTIAAVEAGAIHIVIDVAAYAASGFAIAWLAEQAKLADDWFLRSNDLLDYGQIVRQMGLRPDLFPPGQDVTIVVSYPAMWLGDP